MAVGEKKPVKGAPAEEQAGFAYWLARLDEFGQKNARLILTISAGLIILTVLIIVQQWNRSSLAERVSRDVARAKTVEELLDLKERYGSGDAGALVLASLGHKLCERGQPGDLDRALQEYDEFLQRFPDHGLKDAVGRARQALVRNLEFERDRKEALMQVPSLESHPLKDVRLRDTLATLHEELAKLRRLPSPKPEEQAQIAAIEREIERRLASPVGLGPIKLPNPVFLITVKTKDGKDRGSFRVELFEDEAPNAVASLVELAEKGYFNGLPLSPAESKDRLTLGAKAQGAVDYVLPFEPTSRGGDVGSLIVRRRDAHNAAAEFDLLLRSTEAPGEVTIAGVAAEQKDVEFARKIEAGDTIGSVAVEKKRAHDYKPQTVKP